MAPSTNSPARRPITRLLIANRGEIVVRIASTAHRLGIGTVGVHSDADANSLHVEAVDESVSLGGSTPAESYLRADAVLAAALDTGCDAVHPGYGFLAENADFARAVIDAGLIWVGPTPQQIELLGDKVAAKAAAVAAGVPTTAAITLGDGTLGDGTARDLPDDVPMPALVKAAAGGGGRGMRIVREHADLADAITSASREALSAFGDGTVFIEPYIEHGRHIEVQLLGDSHGSVIHLGDRDCSIQRRNQKVLEEAPAPGLSDATREALQQGALALAAHVGYCNAGTVEFLVGDDGTINFLEVNTRLQVEHPVTEAVTGVDLVELQLRVAAGEPLPLTQDQVRIDGHAIEVRVVAEDPSADWLPSTGRVEAFEVPTSVRCDPGVGPGSVVTPDYDSLLAKITAHAPTREGAALVLGRALRGASVIGPRTNLASLCALLAEPDFRSGQVDTSYFEDHPDVLDAVVPDGADRTALLVAAVLAHEIEARRSDSLWGFAPSAWRNLAIGGQRTVWLDAATAELRPVELLHGATGSTTVLIGDWPAALDDGSLAEDDRLVAEVQLLSVATPQGEIHIGFTADGLRRSVRVTVGAERVVTSGPAGSIVWELLPRFADHGATSVGTDPVAPLPGTVTAVRVVVGDSVADGTVLVVVEAMKMEHTIRASGVGSVSEIRFAEGDRVDAGDVLVVIEPTN